MIRLARMFIKTIQHQSESECFESTCKISASAIEVELALREFRVNFLNQFGNQAKYPEIQGRIIRAEQNRNREIRFRVSDKPPGLARTLFQTVKVLLDDDRLTAIMRVCPPQGDIAVVTSNRDRAACGRNSTMMASGLFQSTEFARIGFSVVLRALSGHNRPSHPHTRRPDIGRNLADHGSRARIARLRRHPALYGPDLWHCRLVWPTAERYRRLLRGRPANAVVRRRVKYPGHPVLHPLLPGWSRRNDQERDRVAGWKLRSSLQYRRHLFPVDSVLHAIARDERVRIS